MVVYSGEMVAVGATAIYFFLKKTVLICGPSRRAMMSPSET